MAKGESLAWVARYPLVLLVAAAVLAGCGSSGGPDRAAGPAGAQTLEGVRAAAGEFIDDLQATHETQACEVLTARAVRAYRLQPGGCPGSIGHYYLFLGQSLSRWYNKILPKLKLDGSTATYRGLVQAQYEDGSWHLENSVL